MNTPRPDRTAEGLRCRGLALGVAAVALLTSCTSLVANDTATPEPGILDRAAWLEEYDEALLIPLLGVVEAISDDINNGMTPSECADREQAQLETYGPDGVIPAIDTFKAGSEDIAEAGNDLMAAAFFLLAGCADSDDIASNIGRELSITAPQKFDNIYQQAANDTHGE